MKNSIKILKVKDNTDIQKLPRKMEDYLPQMKGEVIMVVAPICQGKSNFISNWFLQPQLAAGMFDTIYFFSNTAHQDDTSRFLINEPKAFSIASRARHYNIANIFYIVQKYKAVNNVVRNCCTHLICFAGIYNSGELKSLSDEYDSVGGELGFTALYKKEVQNRKYNFLYGNLQTGKTYLNFDKLLHSNFDDEAKFVN